MIFVIPAIQSSPREAVEDFKDRTVRKIGDLRCPDHHQSPRVRFLGATLRDVTVHMSGCCDKLIQLANRKIAGL